MKNESLIRELLRSPVVANFTPTILALGFCAWFLQGLIVPEMRRFEQNLIHSIEQLHDEIAACVLQTYRDPRHD